MKRNILSLCLCFSLAEASCSTLFAQRSLLDPTFDPGQGVQGGAVESMLLQPDGKVLICGNFTSFDGQPQHYVARLNANGKLDTSFHSDVGYWTRFMALQPDGKVVIGGFFVDVEGQPRNCVARLNADGSLDPTFNPGTGCQGHVIPVDTTAPFVYAVAIQGDGKIIIAGNFTQYNGSGRNSIARLNPDGSIDDSFNVGSGADSWLRSLLIQDNGQILVSGWLQNYNGQPFNRMVRLNSDGSADSSLKPYFGDSTAIYKMVPVEDGKIVVGGHSINTNAPFRSEILRLNPDGSYDSAFNPGGSGANDKVESVIRLPDGKFVIGGYFSMYNGVQRENLARLNADGTLDDTFVANIDSWIYTVAQQKDGRLLISGGFNTVDGVARSGVARLYNGQPPADVKPTISITQAPPDGARLTNGSVAISGTASGDVSDVLFQLNGGDFVPATGTSNWSALVTLAGGTNVFNAKAIDIWGDESDPATLNLFYVMPSSIALSTSGNGRVIPHFRGTNLTVGATYTVEAVAGRGQIFNGWSGSLSASNSVLTFQMQPDMALQASFVPDPFRALAGAYAGLFSSSNGVALNSAGFFSMSLAATRAFTGRLLIEGGAFGFSGRLNEQGAANVRIPRRGKTALTCSLQLDTDAQAVTGTVASDSWESQLLANRAVFNSSNRATNFAGAYTMLIPGGSDPASSPAGNGYAVVTVDSRGNVVMKGSLADGTAISQTVPLSKDGQWPLYVSLYGGKGMLFSGASFAQSGNSSIQGLATWIKTPAPGRFYPGGFTNETQLIGSHYTIPRRGQQVLNLTSGQVVLSGGNLTDPITDPVTLNPNNTITVNSDTNHLKLSISLSQGLVSGSFVNPGTHQPTRIRGVVLQEANEAGGFFLGTSQSGAMMLTPSAR